MIAELVAKYGKENVFVTLESSPIRRCLIISYTCSDDKTSPHEHRLKEEQYKISDKYKIEFEPVTDNGAVFAPRAMYQMDLESMIRTGHASVRVAIPEMVA